MSETLIPLLDLVSKLLIYLGAAAVFGGGLITLLAKEQNALLISVRRYSLSGALLALVAVAINFYAQVGSFAESGWVGMFDETVIAMLWDSSVGYSAAIRSAALGLAFLVFVIAMLSNNKGISLGNFGLIMLGLSAAGFSASFSLLGHVAELPLIIRILLGIHVFIALLWVGSLFPLWRACQIVTVEPLLGLMHRFGLVAMGAVAVLLICGGIMAYQLLGSVSELISTPYGLMLLAKVGLVCVILGFAALHKWRLVPQLTNPIAASRLQHSILLEMLVGLSILILTVLLTTVVGPVSMSE